MKSLIDVVIGNPPYQLNDSIGRSSAKPIYNLFIEKANNITSRFNSMIVPARWYSGGKGLAKFRKDMLSDTRLHKIIDYPDSKECFRYVSIMGGISIILFDKFNKNGSSIKNYKDYKFNKIEIEDYDILIRCRKALKILKKIKKNKSLASKIYCTNPFGLRTNFNNFCDEGIKIYRRGGVSYCDEKNILKNSDILPKYKVIISYAYGDCNNIILNKPILLNKNEACTETYIILSVFNEIEEAKNFISYIKTKFFRYLVSLRKISQIAARDVYRFVPQQYYKKPWNDKELYEKYGLDVDEIEHIEKSIRAME